MLIMLILQLYLLTPAGEQAAEAHNGTPSKKRALAKKFLGSAPVPLGVKLLNWPEISGHGREALSGLVRRVYVVSTSCNQRSRRIFQ
jgi:hypothetical protein